MTDPRPSPEEVLRRWADLMRTDALRLMRFMQANHRIVRDIKPPGGSVRERMESLSESLAPPGAPLEAKVRARLALFSLQGAGLITAGLDAPDEQVFDIAVQVALQTLAR